MFVVAGPAGSGKTTLFPPGVLGVDTFSVDARAAELNGGSYVGIRAAHRREAAAACRAFIEEHIEGRRSFAVETTLRTEAAIRQAEAAKAAGFTTIMLFVGTGDVSVNIERITARGRAGGHSSPETEIRAIFTAAMANLPAAIAVFDEVECLDNSRRGGTPVRVLAFHGGRIVHRASPLPAWAQGLASAGGAGPPR